MLFRSHIATIQPDIAITQANIATIQPDIAITQANIATTQINIATTKANSATSVPQHQDNMAKIKQITANHGGAIAVSSQASAVNRVRKYLTSSFAELTQADRTLPMHRVFVQKLPYPLLEQR